MIEKVCYNYIVSAFISANYLMRTVSAFIKIIQQERDAKEWIV